MKTAVIENPSSATNAIQQEIIAGLWAIANTGPRGSIKTQRAAIKTLLNMPAGFDFLTQQPAKELDALAHRRVWAGRMILMEVVGLELQRRRLQAKLADVDQRMRQILKNPTRFPACRCGGPHAPVPQRESEND